MSPTQPPLINAAHAAFLQAGVSIVVGACDGKLMPTVARATGCRVSADLRRASVFLSATQGARVLECIRENRSIAVVFSQPSTHRTVQLKGNDTEIDAPLPGDMEIIAAYRTAFARELEPLGFQENLIRTLLACPLSDIVSLSFTPAEAYSQTPGPSAGQPLKMQA